MTKIGEDAPEVESGTVSLLVPGANMYGCQPCPICGSVYRYVANNAREWIRCDDCGVKEQVTSRKDE